MAATGQQLLLSSIDDYLGPGETRFFSRGYQRAEYEVYGITVRPSSTADAPCVAGYVDLRYPADWSRKKDGVDLRPHLSTVDALVLGVQLAETHLVHAHRMDRDEQRRMRLRKVVLRAGNAPQEDLKGVELSAKLVVCKEDASAAGGHVSVYDCGVGGMRARCEFEHRASAAEEEAKRYETFEAVLGSATSRLYGEGFKRRRHTIHDVNVDIDELRAHADTKFREEGSVPLSADGVEGGDEPVVSLIDTFVVNLQLAQVLMYELDGLTRATSNTLWMMQTVLSAGPSRTPLPEPETRLQADTAVTGSRLLPLRGASWRRVELSGALGAMSMRASFAHELPAVPAP